MHKDTYTTSTKFISLRLLELEDNDKEVKKLKTKKLSTLSPTFFVNQSIDFFGVIGGLFIGQLLLVTPFLIFRYSNNDIFS